MDHPSKFIWLHLVYYPGKNKIESWSLINFEKILERSNPIGDRILHMTMGHNDSRRVLVRYEVSTEEHFYNVDMYLLDPMTMKEIQYEHGSLEARKHKIENNRTDFQIHQRADGNLQMVSEWSTSISSPRITLYLLEENTWNISGTGDPGSEGLGSDVYGRVGDDGYVYTGFGGILDIQQIKASRLPNQKLIPGLNSMLFLGVSEYGKVRVYVSSSITSSSPVINGVISDAAGLEGLFKWWEHTSVYDFDKRIIFDPARNHTIFIPLDNHSIIQRQIDIEQYFEESGNNYLFTTSIPDPNITPGETWFYKIEVVSEVEGVNIELLFGPETMKIGENGVVSWDVPLDHEGFEEIVFQINNDEDQFIFHKFSLHENKYVENS